MARAIEQAAEQRLRPVLLTSPVAALGLVPIAANTATKARAKGRASSPMQTCPVEPAP
jgi:Cu/Ag efflux pump CusA